MKYNIIYKKDNFTLEVKNKLKNKLIGTLDEVNPDVVFTIGGDGTVLDAVKKYTNNLDKTIFVTINTGNVGFYTEFMPEDIDLIVKLLNDKQNILTYPLLETKINGITHYSLNEVVLSVTHHLFEGKIFVGDTHLMDVRSDGICISTPSGSTAYNKSLGGAVVDFEAQSMQMIVMAPFETVDKKIVSPLILNNDKIITIKPLNNYFDVSYDRNFITYQNVNKIKIKLSLKKVKFLKNKDKNFLKRLREKFISDS